MNGYYIGIPVFLIIVYNWHKISRWWYAGFIKWFRDVESKELFAYRLKHVKGSLEGIESHDPEFKAKKRLKILEIGVGTGVNFQAYPQDTHLIVIDPNTNFRTYYDENRKKFPNISSEELIEAVGEDMHMIPTGSVDAVVTTYVMCIANSNAKMFQEIKRVLAPGGRYIFWEHIREWDFGFRNLWRRLFQDFTNYTKLWPLFMDNCYGNRDCYDLINSSGFSKVAARRDRPPGCTNVYRFLEPHLIGVATK